MASYYVALMVQVPYNGSILCRPGGTGPIQWLHILELNICMQCSRDNKQSEVSKYITNSATVIKHIVLWYK